MLRGLALTMIVSLAAVVGDVAETPNARADSGAEPYENGIGVSVGAHFFLLEDTPFGELVRADGLDVLGTGPAFAISYDRRVLPWLSLGGTLAYRYSVGRKSKLDAGIRGSDDGHGPEASLMLLTPRVFGRASFYTPDDFGDGAALEMGVELSLGVGATLLSLRGDVDAAAHLELGGALLWSLHIGCWAASFRIVHEVIFQEGLGPLDVGFGPTWMPTVEVRLEKRW